jgi:hypothetical protein
MTNSTAFVGSQAAAGAAANTVINDATPPMTIPE